jgi:hypothetical protein
MNESDIETLKLDLDGLGKWTVENAMKINPGKSKAISFTRTRVKDLLNYFWRDQRISEASNCEYLGIILSSGFSLDDLVIYTVQKSLEGTSFHNACSQKRKLLSEKFGLHVTSASDS